MTPIVLPRMSVGTALVVRIIIVGVPATVAVVISLLILFFGMFMNERRQQYALRAAGSVFRMITAITGITADDDKRGRSG